MKDFVFFTHDDLNEGCGVLVGDLFITAAHVVLEHDFLLSINGEKICLKKEDALYLEYKESEDGADIAIFRLEGYKSNLELDTTTPQIGMTLDSISYKHIIENKTNETNIFLKEAKDYYQLIECKATIEVLEGNFYICKTTYPLKEGSSGSPVFRNGKVFGILLRGKPGTNICAFQSSSSIIAWINNLEKNKLHK